MRNESELLRRRSGNVNPWFTRSFIKRVFAFFSKFWHMRILIFVQSEMWECRPFDRVLPSRAAGFSLRAHSSLGARREWQRESVKGWSVTAPHGGRNSEGTRTCWVGTEFKMMMMNIIVMLLIAKLIIIIRMLCFPFSSSFNAPVCPSPVMYICVFSGNLKPF